MQITEINFKRTVDPVQLSCGMLGHFEITLDHSVILDEVELFNVSGELTLHLWGATLCTFGQLGECLKMGLSANCLENFRQRLALRGEGVKPSQQSRTRAA